MRPQGSWLADDSWEETVDEEMGEGGESLGLACKAFVSTVGRRGFGSLRPCGVIPCCGGAIGGFTEVLCKVVWDGAWGEEEGRAGENPVWRRIGGIVLTGDVFKDDVAIRAYKLRQDLLEDPVDVLVPAVAPAPCINYPLVVTVHEKGSVGVTADEYSADK